MKDEIHAEEQAALKIIEECDWDEGRKMLMRKIITDAAYATNGSPDKIGGIAETTFRLAFMDISRDKELDIIKKTVNETSDSVKSISSDVKSVIERLDANDKKTDEIKTKVDDQLNSMKRTGLQTIVDGITKLPPVSTVTWASVVALAIAALAYRTELVTLLSKLF